MDGECHLQTPIVICALSHLGYHGSAYANDVDPAGCRLALPGRAALPRRHRSWLAARGRRLVFLMRRVWIMSTPSRIERICLDKGLKMTEQRRVIARVLSDATDHPDVEQVYRRATEIDPHISIATVYRTVRLFEEANILERHDFRDGRSRYEEAPEVHHDHLIDIQSGRVIEFRDEQIEQLQRKVAEKLGYRLVDHRLELYAVPMEETATKNKQSTESGNGRRS